MTDVRPEVLELLNSRDPLKPFHRADGQDFTEAEAALMADATPAERAVAAQARLIARAEAGQAIRTKLAENLAASGVADQHVTRVTEGLDELETRLGRDWPVMVATEAGLPVVQVREMFGQVPPR